MLAFMDWPRMATGDLAARGQFGMAASQAAGNFYELLGQAENVRQVSAAERHLEVRAAEFLTELQKDPNPSGYREKADEFLGEVTGEIEGIATQPAAKRRMVQYISGAKGPDGKFIPGFSGKLQASVIRAASDRQNQLNREEYLAAVEEGVRLGDMRMVKTNLGRGAAEGHWGPDEYETRRKEAQAQIAENEIVRAIRAIGEVETPEEAECAAEYSKSLIKNAEHFKGNEQRRDQFLGDVDRATAVAKRNEQLKHEQQDNTIQLGILNKVEVGDFAGALADAFRLSDAKDVRSWRELVNTEAERFAKEGPVRFDDDATKGAAYKIARTISPEDPNFEMSIAMIRASGKLTKETKDNVEKTARTRFDAAHTGAIDRAIDEAQKVGGRMEPYDRWEEGERWAITDKLKKMSTAEYTAWKADARRRYDEEVDLREQLDAAAEEEINQWNLVPDNAGLPPSAVDKETDYITATYRRIREQGLSSMRAWAAGRPANKRIRGEAQQLEDAMGVLEDQMAGWHRGSGMGKYVPSYQAPKGVTGPIKVQGFKPGDTASKIVDGKIVNGVKSIDGHEIYPGMEFILDGKKYRYEGTDEVTYLGPAPVQKGR